MILIKLICLFFLLLIFIIIIGLIFSKLKLNLISLRYNTQKNKKIEFKANIEIYLFNFLKIIIASLNEDGIKILNKKISYMRLYEKAKLNELLNKDFENYINFQDLKVLNIKLEKLYFDGKIGVRSAILTGYIVSILSTILSFIINLGSKKEIKKYYNFKILPIYSDINVADVKLECIISLKMIHILYVIKNQKIRRIKENGRTSNRRSYANSDG